MEITRIHMDNLYFLPFTMRNVLRSFPVVPLNGHVSWMPLAPLLPRDAPVPDLIPPPRLDSHHNKLARTYIQMAVLVIQFSNSFIVLILHLRLHCT
jgi:hypothetical protein